MEQQGIVTFFSSQHAMSAETLLKGQGYTVSLVPGPKEISPNCGVALRFEPEHKAAVEQALKGADILFEEVHLYTPAQETNLLKKLLGKK